MQAIVFDPKTEENARNSEPVKDRIVDEMTNNHTIEYWYETTKELSPKSYFIIVQNQKDKFSGKDHVVGQYAARNNLELVHLSAKTGEDLDDLWHHLRKMQKNCPNMACPCRSPG
ncbi:MAG: hypothetical protein IPJ40_21355 [Saprospirales bacterium]|nr:hypothetical protein [Saprospirales bacterium]